MIFFYYCLLLLLPKAFRLDSSSSMDKKLEAKVPFCALNVDEENDSTRKNLSTLWALFHSHAQNPDAKPGFALLVYPLVYRRLN